MEVVLGIGIIALVVTGIVQIKRYRDRCPECKKWGAGKIINTEIIDRKKYFKTVTRVDVHKNDKGEEIGRTERNEQVHMIMDTTKYYCECKYCGIKWTYTSTSEYEG